jgi:hypothetical protein
METRIEYLEALIGESANKHHAEIDAAKKKLGTVEAAVSKCAKTEHCSDLETRVSALELLEHRLEGFEKKQKEVLVGLDGKSHKTDIDRIENIVLPGLDTRLIAIEEKHLRDFTKRLGDYEKKYVRELDQVKAKFGDVDLALKECANIEHYLGLDRKFASIKQLIEQRLGQLEMQFAEGFSGNEMIKEIEQRCINIKEEQKKARDVLVSSMTKTESCEAEMGCRIDNLEAQFENRLGIERSIYAELKRVWQEIGKEQPPIIKEVVKEVIVPQTKREVIVQQPRTLVQPVQYAQPQMVIQRQPSAEIILPPVPLKSILCSTQR